MTMNVVDVYAKDSAKLEYQAAEKTIEIVTPDHEEGFCLLLKNEGGSSATVTIKSGNSIYAMGDYELTLQSDEEAVINLKNTGRFKNVHGEKSGRIIAEITVGAPSDIKVCAVAL